MFFGKKVETAAEKTTLSVGDEAVVVRPALTNAQIKDIYSVMREVAKKDLLSWCEPPKKIISKFPPQGSSSSEIPFPASPHFGVFRGVYSENGLRIIYGILEQDGISFDIDGMDDQVKEQIVPAPGINPLT